MSLLLKKLGFLALASTAQRKNYRRLLGSRHGAVPVRLSAALATLLIAVATLAFYLVVL